MSRRDARRVVLDADISWKLAHEIQGRGRRDATALHLEGIASLLDGQLLKKLAADFEPFVLVTWDNEMPTAHAGELAHFASTVAVVNRKGMKGWAGNEAWFIRNTVHRWLHRIEAQEPGSVRFYTTHAVSVPGRSKPK